MHAKDVMTVDVVTASPDTEVRTIAQRLIERRISAVPIVDEGSRVVGIVSEGDLKRRVEIGTDALLSPWWLELFVDPDKRARAFAKAHGLSARDVMTAPAITVAEDATLEEITRLFERHRIKRVPVVRNGAIVGIVSRANLLRGLVAREDVPAMPPDDDAVREHIAAGMKKAGITGTFLDFAVNGNAVVIWGYVPSEAEKAALRVAAETAPGIKTVDCRVRVGSFPYPGGSWA